jgi:3-deoxy-manno-octulosonate cytidylyltransferase (CMP-KDO synthetase)
MRVAAVIPARMQSTRLPGKPLRGIAGVPMIVRVFERARSCPGLDRIIVATDAEEIVRTVRQCGGEAWMTSPAHRTGSDRVAEVAEQLSEDLILNLQGDEPLLPVSTVAALVEFGRSSHQLTAVTAAIPLTRVRDVANPNIVKVVCDKNGRALYFSRWAIPYDRSSPVATGDTQETGRLCEGYLKHIGIYLYNREFLLRYVKMEPGCLERSESLEQLRILEHGYAIHVVEVTEDSVSVDTPEDLAEVEALVRSGSGEIL